MTPLQPPALKRGATEADTTPVTHRLSGRRRLILAAISAALTVVATLPFALTTSADRGTDDATTEEVQMASLIGVALTGGQLPAGEGEVDPGLDASPPGQPEEAPPAEAPAAPGAEPDPCAEALAWVADAGLPLPAGVGYHCPSTQFSHHGAACWNGSPCRGTGFIAINLELIGDASPEYLRHVVAHEVCHILDFQATGRTSEAGADACAAAHGA